MKKPDKKESPVMDFKPQGADVKKRYFTAEEAMSFLEPRIRGMFK